MAGFYFDNLAKNLPDAYKKDTSSNNYKILEIERLAVSGLRENLEQIEKIMDIDNAVGATLDMYGMRFGQSRGTATDEQYRIMIKSKIVRSLSDGSYKSVIDAICFTFSCDKEDVLITESIEKPMTVSLEKAPMDAVIKAGFSMSQAQQIVKKLLPVTVELESFLFEGTFEFSGSENEYDGEKGFGEIGESGELNNEGIGGYLGWLEETEQELPI